MLWFWLVVLGGIGVVLRFLMVSSLNTESFPYGIFLANILGSAGIGWVYFSPFLSGSPLRPAILIGFFGALTTFSSFSLDVLNMIERGRLVQAMFYVLSTNGLALSASWVGMKLARITQ